MQMQNRLAEGTTSNILRNPGQLLSFILHVLDSAKINQGENMNGPRNKFAFQRDNDSDEANGDDGDSDDEAPDSEVIGPDDDLIETAITLLLSILEGTFFDFSILH